MADSVSVQVALRVRPLVESEILKGCQLCLECIDNEPQVVVRGTDKAFTFNYVFGPDDDNEYFYETAVKELVTHVFKGYNVTILAYGQTGSGKTYSMGTTYNGGENFGIIPRAVNDIFKSIHEMPERDFKITVSFMELYQEQLFDLLGTTKTLVDIREDGRSIIVPGLTEVSVMSTEDTTKCLIRGSLGRATGATAMNAQSSRSHAIFTITIYQQMKDDISNSMTAKFHLVDLAGSERPKKTKATGERFREGININRGLLALGNVISALGDETQRGFISYRDSKLTRLLQDSLGGNSLTLMIACVSPADYNLEETVSTLRYADRARRIKNKPIINQDPRAAQIAKLKQELQDLQLELLNGNRTSQCPEEHKMLQEECTNLVSKNRKLTEALNNAFTENTNLVERALLAELARDRMKVKLCELQAEYGNAMESLNQTVDPSTCPAVYCEQLKQLRDLQLKIQDLQAEQKRSAEEILNHEISAGISENGTREEDEMNEKPLVNVDIDERREAHTLYQVELNRELKELNRALALKEELAAQLAANSNQILNLKTDYESNMKDLEIQVQILHKEKEELLRSLKEVQNSTLALKENEQHKQQTKRLADLEQKISCLNKKIAEQNRLIKMKEKSDQKIIQLNNEIQNMKQTKVRLIKQMKVESEQFRNWKVQRERELSKLRDQDRKRQNQMVRMERLHTKQQNVLRRKVEEAAAINKRLKDALALQKNAQERRINMGSAMKVQTWLSQELEVIVSTMDAEKSLEQLMEDRAILTEQLNRLKLSIAAGDVIEYERHEMDEEIKQLSEDISVRNTQIADLQQKILDSDQDNKCKTRWDCVQSLSDAKFAMKYLFDMTVETKREKAAIENKLSELLSECASKEKDLQEHEQQLKQISQAHQQEIIQLEKEHEEKVFVLLNQLNGPAGDSENFIQLLEQVRIKQERIEQLELKLAGTKKPKRALNLNNTANISGMLDETFSMISDEDISDDDKNDPDWQKTPIFKRMQRMRSTSIMVDNQEKAVKRTSDGKSKCTCKSGQCSSKRCGCRKVGSLCGGACKCHADECSNRETRGHHMSMSSEGSDGENEPFKKPRALPFSDSS